MHIRNYLIILLFLSASAYSDEWNGVIYDEARLYYFNFEDYDYKKYGALKNIRLIEENKLGHTVVNKEGYLLSKDQVKEFLSAVSKQDHETPIGICNDPRHGIVFYKKHVITGYIEWCFECMHIVSEPQSEISGSYLNWGNLAVFVGSTGIPIDPKGTTSEEYNKNYHEQLRHYQKWQQEQSPKHGETSGAKQ